jgi:hypothetical protein
MADAAFKEPSFMLAGGYVGLGLGDIQCRYVLSL